MVKKINIVLVAYFSFSVFIPTLSAQEKKQREELPTPPVVSPAQSMWGTDELYKQPKTFPCPDLVKKYETANIKGIEIENVLFKGKPTRFFAWYGIPEQATRERPVPAIVLVHGGGGSAFKSWVETWMKRGYAAIAMCTNGNYPIKDMSSDKRRKPWIDNPNDIKKSWGDFDGVDLDVKDQWTYRAIAAVIKSHSFLRSLPEVDEDKVGLTGISWGGYLACITSGVDKRLKFVAPVYGCGFYGEGSTWRKKLIKMGEKGKRWIRLWDAARYTPYSTVPMLFCTGTNDHFFHMPAWQKTANSVKGTRTLCLKIRMVHCHPPAGDPKEITAFANNILRTGSPLAQITRQEFGDNKVVVEYESEAPLAEANLCFTKSGDSVWEKREWERIPVKLDSKLKRVEADIPESAQAFYINLIDENGMVVSSEFRERN